VLIVVEYGIFMRLRSSRSMMKHSGALISSRLIAPNVGSSAAMVSTSFFKIELGDFDVIDVYAGELLEENRLAFHHGLSPPAALSPQSQHRGTVGNDADQVAAGCETENIERVPRQSQRSGRDTGE